MICTHMNAHMYRHMQSDIIMGILNRQSKPEWQNTFDWLHDVT